ncbi:MAG TPA: hypothetical protein DCP36_17395 [Sporomusaceae bacterium]|jgi:hypothetical protein|uniref:hypothetical protein n=1 Tax=Anaerospora sp. TaxID=1960278 RepID=UPI000EB87170|nr:hypothetical protein [Anaerospora sp.]MDF2928170.1 hypothetical protein [Anaerospora sp.]HAK74873.1 hypothetical protein [Sporomusaceae bacterium]
MPYCSHCGNSSQFESSKVPSVAPYANGPSSGVIGSFDSTGALIGMTRLGATKAFANAAAIQPEAYFDTCTVCGSTELSWSEMQ